MLRSVEAGKYAPFKFDPAARGFHAVYHPGEVNRCPGCGRSHWIIGRFSAECGFCAAALPLADTGMLGTGLLHRPRYEGLDEAA